MPKKVTIPQAFQPQVSPITQKSVIDLIASIYGCGLENQKATLLNQQTIPFVNQIIQAPTPVNTQLQALSSPLVFNPEKIGEITISDLDKIIYQSNVMDTDAIPMTWEDMFGIPRHTFGAGEPWITGGKLSEPYPLNIEDEHVLNVYYLDMLPTPFRAYELIIEVYYE